MHDGVHNRLPNRLLRIRPPVTANTAVECRGHFGVLWALCQTLCMPQPRSTVTTATSLPGSTLRSTSKKGMISGRILSRHAVITHSSRLGA